MELLNDALGESDVQLREDAFRLVSYITHGDDAMDAEPAVVGVPVMQPSMPVLEQAPAAFVMSQARGTSDAVATS